MPGRDGTGPVGMDPMSGRGFGVCLNMALENGTRVAQNEHVRRRECSALV